MDQIYAALIGGLSGIVCAWLTAKLSNSANLKAVERAEQERTGNRQRSAAFLVSQAAPALRTYAAACFEVAHDDGYSREHPEDGQNHATAQVQTPYFRPTDLNVEWESLPAALMTSVLTFPEHAQTAAAALFNDDGYEDPPFHYVYFLDRQTIYCRLGTEALGLAKQLHQHLDIEPHEYGASLQSKLEERQKELTAEQGALERRQREHMEKMNALIPAIEVAKASSE